MKLEQENLHFSSLKAYYGTNINLEDYFNKARPPKDGDGAPKAHTHRRCDKKRSNQRNIALNKVDRKLTFLIRALINISELYTQRESRKKYDEKYILIYSPKLHIIKIYINSS